MTSSSNFSSNLGSMRSKSQVKWGLPNGGVSYTSQYDWKAKVESFPSRKANIKLSFDNNTLPSLHWVSVQPSVEKTTIVRAKLVSPTQLQVKILMQKKTEKNPVEAVSWNMTITAHDRIRNDVSWRPEVGQMLFERMRSGVNQTFLKATDGLSVHFSNFRRNFTDRIIPLLNKTWGDIDDRFIKPTYMKFISHLNEIQFPGTQKSVGDTVLIIHEKLQGYHQELKSRLWNTFPGRILKHSGIHETVTYILSERIPKYLKSLQQQRPPFMRTVFARKIKPLLEKRLIDAYTSFNISHPLIWENFMSAPRLSYSAHAIAAYLSNNIPRYVGKQWVWKTYQFHGMLFGGDLVRTIDGQLYRLPEFKLNKCSHLLAADFKDGEFALISTKDSITYFTPSITVRFNSRCKVYIDRNKTPSELPWASEDQQTIVNFDNGMVKMVIVNLGILVKCDTQDRITYIDFSGSHFNHSLGLLGTADHEPSTDFRLPSGEVTESIGKFLNSFELTGDSSCVQDEQPISCGSSPLRNCKEYFKLPSSPLKACFSAVTPVPFEESCDSITADCGEDDPEKVACDLSAAYVALCRESGVEINKPCGLCEKKSLGETWREDIRDKSADVVFVMSRNNNVAKGGKLVESMMNIARKMKYQDILFGLVSYGSEMLGSQAITHTLGGGELGSAKNLEIALRSLSMDSDGHYPAFDALFKAINFEYRPFSHRLIFLVTEWTHVTSVTSIHTSQMLSMLKSNSITLNIISMYEPLSASRVLAVRYNGEAIMLKKQKTSLVLPKDEYTELVKASKGSFFYLERIINAGKKLLRHFHKYIQEEALIGQNNMCRECGCYSGKRGTGKTLCRAVIC